jgi:phosphate uptake regulator
MTTSTRKHTDKSYDKELDDLRSQLLTLGGKVENEIALSRSASATASSPTTCSPPTAR